MLYLFFPIIAGASIVLARIVNYKLAEKIGIFQGTFFNNLVGLVFSIIFLLLSSEFAGLDAIKFNTSSILIYLGGFLGVIVVSVSSYMTPKMSAFYFTLFLFVGQLFAATAIDYILLGSVSAGKATGGILVLSGLIYNLSIDAKNEKIISLEQENLA
ncbi:MAG: DMT family transporter [Proteocatella sp.]